MDDTRLSRIIDEIENELARAQLYLSIAFPLNAMYRNERVTSARHFFYGSYYASLREGLLSISKLLIHHEESITVSYLLDYAMSNPSEYGNVSEDEVNAMVVRHRRRIAGLDDLVRRLRPIRDQDLAHIDKRRISNPNAYVPEPIDFTELDEALEALHQVINEHDGAHRNKELSLQHLRNFSTNDLEYLISLIEAADAPPKG